MCIRDMGGGGRLFLAFLLAFSLLGVGGTQALADTVAAEPSEIAADAETQIDPVVSVEISAEDSEGAQDAPETKPDDRSENSSGTQIDLEAGTEVPADTSAKIEGEPQVEAREESKDEALSQTSTAAPAFRMPEERYVFEYVYGVVSNDHAIFSNDPFDPYDSYFGTLVSKALGRIMGEGMVVEAVEASKALTAGASVIPFQSGGKYGLWSLAEGRMLVEAQYDIAGSSGNGSKWGFIKLGNKAADGTYPQAKAVIYNGSTEVLSVPLDDYEDYGRVEYDAESGASHWSISWYDSSDMHHELWYAEGSNGFQSIPVSNDDDDHFVETTYDGRGVSFSSSDAGISFKVRDKNGTWGNSIALATDVRDTDQCSVVSNIIEVWESNGHEYQYFDLSGNLLQSYDDMRFEGVGNYVAYARIDFESQENAYVFLDTSGANGDSREIPCVQGRVVEDGFECLTGDNKIQRYDADLKLVKEFTSSLNLVQQRENGEQVDWNLVDFGNDLWMLSQTVGFYDNVVDRVSDFYQGTSSITRQSLGLDSSYVSMWGTIGDHYYLMDDSGSNKLRIYDKDFKPAKTVDLSSRVPAGFTIDSLYADAGDDEPCIELDLRLLGEGDDGTSFEDERVILSKAFELTDFSEVRGYDKVGSFYVAKKGGKYGFVDGNLKPQTDFVYDGIDGWISGFRFIELNGCVLAEQGGKQRLLDASLNDVLGFSFDSMSALAHGVYRVVENGTAHVFDSQFHEVDMQGYRPIDPGYFYGSARTLPNGSALVYAKDAQGRVGAIDSTGKVLIPFQYKDYAECADADGMSDYILLRDEKGWFFVSVQELQGGTVNPECEAKGHDYEEAVHEPTCEENGYTQKVCKRCGYGYRVNGSGVPMLGHDYVLTAEPTEPTCTEDGKGAEYMCTRCQKVKRDAGKPSLGGHVNFDWVVTKSPTCTEDGFQERICDRCGLAEQEEIKPLGHAWSAPVWEWSADLSSAFACSDCVRGGCGEQLRVDADMTHDRVEGGTRHSARVQIAGRSYRDGRLALTWVDANGVTRSLLVRGAPVVDGFSVKPDGLVLPADASVAIDVSEVEEGGVFDALVAKMGDGWPGGTFEVVLNVDGEEVHDNFGTLAFSFPAGDGSAHKKATVYHCHKNDRSNITAHDVVVSGDGIAFLSDITDLSMFAIEVTDEEGTATVLTSTKPSSSPLAATGDGSAAPGKAGAVAILALALVGVCAVARRRWTGKGTAGPQGW